MCTRVRPLLRRYFFIVTLSITSMANAAEIVAGGVEYANDKIEQNGVVRGCAITAAIISPPSPEIVNFQVLIIAGRPAFKITAGEVNWTEGKWIAAANFLTAEFNHPNAFKKSITPEGQLLAVLIDDRLGDAFLRAFLGGRYAVQLRRTDVADERTYYIERGPGRDVALAFVNCLNQEMASLP
jgi:hypothetical protein